MSALRLTRRGWCAYRCTYRLLKRSYGDCRGGLRSWLSNGSWNPRQMAVAAGDDLYSLLGVPVTASPQQIADARRRPMRTWHPDLIPSPDALAKSKAINRAAHISLDPVQRRSYDESRLSVARPRGDPKQPPPQVDATSHPGPAVLAGGGGD